MSTATDLSAALWQAGFKLTPDPADHGHVRVYRTDRLVGEYVIREGHLEHFELLGRTRDWWKHVEPQTSYVARVHELIRWAA